MNKKYFNYELISKARPILLGISTLWVVLYHSEIPFSRNDGPGLAHLLYLLDYNVYFIKSIGQIGVEIFLFLSAIGLYFSLEKNDNIKSFYIRRIKRIIPEYLFVNIIWELYSSNSLSDSIKDILGISLFESGNRDNWFFILIFFLYFIFPFIHKLMKKYNHYVPLFFIVISILINYIISKIFPITFVYTELAFRRIPVFLLGCFFAYYVKNKSRFNMIYIIIPFSLFVLSYRFFAIEKIYKSPLYRYVLGISGVSLVFIVAFLIQSNIVKSIFNFIFEKIGKYSLEMYLLFEKVLLVLMKNKVFNNPYIMFFCAFVISIILAILLDILINKKSKVKVA